MACVAGMLLGHSDAGLQVHNAPSKRWLRLHATLSHLTVWVHDWTDPNMGRR